MFRNIALGCALAVFVLPAAALAAEPEESIIWVRHFKANPGQEREFVEMMTDLHGATFDGLIEDGKLLSWGIAVPFTRTEGNWTHAIWLSAPSWAEIDDFISAFEDEEKSRTPEENKANMRKFMSIVEPDSIHDEIFRTVAAPARRGIPSEKPQYIKIAQYKIKPGCNSDAIALYRRYALPVYEELLSSGAIIGTGFTMREVTPDGDWTHHAWISTKDLSSFDKVKKAFERAEKARSEGENKEFIEKLTEIVDFDAHRSQILRVVHCVQQEQPIRQRASR